MLACVCCVQLLYGGVFGIDAETGELSVTGLVDHESRDQYQLVIVARDGLETTLTPGRSAQVKVTVRVTDINDNSPQITVDSLSAAGIAEVCTSLL